MNEIHEAAVVAAAWWAGKIGGNTRHGNGDTSLSSAFAMWMADAGQETPSSEQINAFKTALIRGIEELALRMREVPLFCDYGPGGILHNAAEEAGINELNFPFKTGMFVSPDQVRVSDGYAQPWESIWERRERHGNA